MGLSISELKEMPKAERDAYEQLPLASSFEDLDGDTCFVASKGNVQQMYKKMGRVPGRVVYVRVIQE